MACDPNDLLKAASCFQCLSKKEQLMVQAYLLCQILSPTPTVSAPVLSWDDLNGVLNWTFSGTNPDHWNVEQSSDGVSGWVVVDTVAGSLRTSSAIDSPGGFARVIGFDSGNNQIIPTSNVVELI
jgi:hypothetical protein